jgi:hypothetical protein
MSKNSKTIRKQLKTQNSQLKTNLLLFKVTTDFSKKGGKLDQNRGKIMSFSFFLAGIGS